MSGDNKQVMEIEAKPISPELLISQAIGKVDVATMERLLAMRTQLKHERAKEAFYEALSKFQSETPAVPKTKKVKYDTKTGGKVDYHYAPIEVIVDTVKSGLEKNGFSYTLKTEQTDTKITVTCEVHHVEGHTESTSLTVPMATGDKMNAIQQIGSAITYAKRYSFCNALGIMTADEDTDAVQEEETPPAKDDLKSLQEKVNKALIDKLSPADIGEDDKLAIFYDIIVKARGGIKLTDYEKKSITTPFSIQSQTLLEKILPVIEAYQL